VQAHVCDARKTISVDRECLGGRQLRARRCSHFAQAFAITTFELSRHQVWQGNCFMGIDTGFVEGGVNLQRGMVAIALPNMITLIVYRLAV